MRRRTEESKAWTPDQDLIVSTVGTEEAMRILGRTYASVSVRRRRLLGSTRQRRTWTPEQDRIVLTESTQEAMRKLGRTHASVSHRRWRLRRRAGATGAQKPEA